MLVSNVPKYRETEYITEELIIRSLIVPLLLDGVGSSLRLNSFKRTVR